jgi:hypothetical protein
VSAEKGLVTHLMFEGFDIDTKIGDKPNSLLINDGNPNFILQFCPNYLPP